MRSKKKAQESTAGSDQARRFAGVSDLISEAVRIRTLGVHGQAVDAGVTRTAASAWVPTTDIFAVGEDLHVLIELPGVDPAGIDLRLSQGILTVSGSREGGATKDPTAFLVRERYVGDFRRSITLPEGTEADRVTAEFSHGLVELTVRGGAAGSAGSRIPLVDRSGETPSRSVEGEAPSP